jgi:hypothetical protein
MWKQLKRSKTRCANPNQTSWNITKSKQKRA